MRTKKLDKLANERSLALRARTLGLRGASFVTALAVGAATLTCGASSARAEEVSPKGKGIVGGALLGAEVVVIIESIAGVRKTWAYGVGAGVGAIGGGIGGYFVEQGSTDGRAPVYMLAGGLALIIPAVVLTLNATRYMPDESASADTGAPSPDQPAADPGRPPVDNTTAPATTPPANPITPPPANPTPPAGAPTTPNTPNSPQGHRAAPRRTQVAAAAIPDALFQMNVDLARSKSVSAVGVPVPSLRPMWSSREQKDLGVAQGSEVRVPVVKVTF